MSKPPQKPTDIFVKYSHKRRLIEIEHPYLGDKRIEKTAIIA
jgi:hypothetical protein